MSRRRWRHPTTRRLVRWLTEGDPSLDAHLDQCERCAGRLERLSESTAPVAEALRETLTVPGDLADRIRSAVARRVEAQADFELLGELLTVPWETALVLADEPPRPGGSQ